jgi:hypothetical protein
MEKTRNNQHKRNDDTQVHDTLIFPDFRFYFIIVCHLSGNRTYRK